MLGLKFLEWIHQHFEHSKHFKISHYSRCDSTNCATVDFAQPSQSYQHSGPDYGIVNASFVYHQ